jgi:predicted ATPase/class 3 adenylate cyclase
MGELPSGTVTFVFTDLEVSTRLWEQEPEAMRGALARHDAVLREAVVKRDGHVVKGTGDGVLAVFATADAAVLAAIDAQVAMGVEDWPFGEPLRIRVGVHTGVAEFREGDYFGSSVNRAARLMGVAHGGQVVVSQAVVDLTRDALFGDVELVDLGEHRLRDLSRAEHVYQVNAPGLGGTFPPLRSLDAFPGNLPLQVTSLVGRERELARTLAALEESRVVSLTGVGGVGKTRLALQVAAEVLPRFRYGAWLCELAPVRSSDAVVDAVAAVFDVVSRSGQSLEQALVEFLQGKELLLVLDNCEHLLAPAAALVETLERACPRVAILVTSREGLGIDGERILAVPSLGAPAAGSGVADIAAADAVQLFVERARAVKDDFVLTERNADAVAQVCRQLDGVPLALELAAARVRAMNPRDLAARLDRRFQLLAGGRRGAVERHQTLRATIDWSYDLLDPAAQRLLARVTVFSGGWTLQAAEGVCVGGPVDAASVWELTERLVAQSLLVAEDRAFETRYRLLETIRQYGEERLAELDDTTELRRGHAEYFVDFQLDIGAQLVDPAQVDAGRRLTAETENLLAAFAFAVDQGDADLAFRLVAAYPSLGWSLGREFRFPLEAALTMAGATDHPQYPYALASSGWYAAFSGDSELAVQRAGEARKACLGLDDNLVDRVEVIAVTAEAVNAFNIGDWACASERMERAAEIWNRLEDRGLTAAALAGAAVFAVLAGDTETGHTLASEGLRIARAVGVPGIIGRNLSALAGALAERAPEQARTLLRESIEVSRFLDYENVNDVTQAVLVGAHIGDWHVVLECAPYSVAHLHWLGDLPQLAGVLTITARVIVENDPDTAAILLGISRRLAVTAGTSNVHDARPDDGDSRARELISALRLETVALIDAAIGADRRLELRTNGEAMGSDDAIAYTLERLRAQPH